MVTDFSLLLEIHPLLPGHLTFLVFLPLHWLLLPSVLHSLPLVFPSACTGTAQGSVLLISVYTLPVILPPLGFNTIYMVTASTLISVAQDFHLILCPYTLLPIGHTLLDDR